MDTKEFIKKWVESLAANKVRLFNERKVQYNSLPILLKMFYIKPNWEIPESYNGFKLMPLIRLPRPEYKILETDKIENTFNHSKKVLFHTISISDYMAILFNRRIKKVKNNFNGHFFSIGDDVPYYGKIIGFYLFYYHRLNIRVVFDNNTDECLKYLGAQP